MELLLKLIEKLGDLLKLRKERSRALFEDHIEPIYSMVREVTDDYLRMFEETREQVADDSISLKTIHKSLVNRRKKLELVRIELMKYAKAMYGFNRNDQIENFTHRCLELTVLHPVVGIPPSSRATSTINEIEEAMDLWGSHSRVYLLNYIDWNIDIIKGKWAEITDIYILLKRKMLK